MLGGHELQKIVGLDCFSRTQEPSQGIVNQIETFVLGGMQDLQVLFDGRCFGRAIQQLVVGHAESCGGVHVVHVLIVDERPRLADQRVDHVAKVDRFLAPAELTRHTLKALILIPELKMVLVDTHFKLQADVLAADRIDIPLDANDTVRPDRHRQGSASASSAARQWIQAGGFFTERLFSGCITPRSQLTHERQEVVDALEVATFAEPQCLVKCVLEVAVRRLDVSVLMGLANVDPMALKAIVIEQITIRSGEFSVVRKVVHGRRQAVTANPARNAARQMQGVLQTCRESFEGLRMTEVDVLPVRIGEDRMEHHVVEGLAADRDLERIHDDEVESDHVARMVNLWEDDFLLDTVLELPTLYSSFQCSSNRVRHARLTFRRVVLLFEPIQNRVRFESRIVLKSFFDFAPILFERIWASAVGALGSFHLAWQEVCLAILPDRLFTHF